MAKRLTDTGIWDKRWFRELPPKYKCFWKYLLDRCNNAGIWDVDVDTAAHFIGETVDKQEIEAHFDGHIHKLTPERWFIPDFIEFQYGCEIEELNPSNPAHLSVIRILEKNNILGACKPLKQESTPPMDKDMDMDKDKEKDKEKEIQAEARFNVVWKEYPKKVGKQLAYRSFKSTVKTKQDVVDIMKALGNYKISARVKRGYVQDGSRWFRHWKEWVEYTELEQPKNDFKKSYQDRENPGHDRRPTGPVTDPQRIKGFVGQVMNSMKPKEEL